MKNTFMTTFFCCVLSTGLLAQQAEKVFVKSFNLQGKQSVLLKMDGQVAVETWDSDIMRVQMTISIPNVNVATLKSLARAGRYNLQSKIEGDDLIVNAPGLEREIKIRGQKLEEQIQYLVYAPKDIVINNIADETATSSKDAAEMPTSL